MKILFWFWITLAVTGAAGAQDALDCHLVPGWEQLGPRRHYAPDNLYDYRDGGAEGYLVFGFRRMQGLDCKSAAGTLAIDVSEMADADMAYGMYAANRDPGWPSAKIGMGGQVQPRSATFSKGNYYVELVLTDGPPDANLTDVLKEFAVRFAARLAGRDTPPEALQWFPAEGLLDVRLVPESVLGLSMLKRGYVAKYNVGQAFIVQEESPEAAAELMKALRGRFVGWTPARAGDESFAANAPYLQGLCIVRKGRFVAGFANTPDGPGAVARCVQLAALLP